MEPKFFKARTIPYAYKDKVEEELRRLEEAGIITPVPFAQSAAPIVPIVKPNGKIRICGDFKITANKQIETEKYPLPKAEDIFAKLAGCKVFSRLDLRDAYSQLELDESSKELVVINTPKGLFKYNFLPYGISSASAVFKKHMEILLRNQAGVTPFQDDILLGVIDHQDHLEKLDSLLQRFEEAGLRVRREKCQFAKTSMDFLGYHLDKDGLHPQKTKTQAISDAPEPKNVEELRSFLGLLNYYAKFIPNYATQLSPLYRLLEKSSEWKWQLAEQSTFKKAKEFLTTSNFLVHYDPSKEVRLACDASPVGIGCVISHFIDGEERPISFASRTISAAEKNYSQLEREALALVYGVMKFRDYLLGRRFKLITDHQPLVSLLSQDKPIPQMSAARLQRWSLLLSAYDYQIEYKKGSLHSNADALSRLPLSVQHDESPMPTEYVLLIEKLQDSPMTMSDIKLATERDTLLTRILTWVVKGWNQKVKQLPETQPYYIRRDQLSTLNGTLMIGQRIVMPGSLRQKTLEYLHETHQGIVRMKSLEKSMYWWPGIDSDIITYVNQCEICQSCAPEPPKTFSAWPTVKSPWQRVHCDFAGPVEGKMLFITVDAYSKWIEVDIVASTTTDAVIRSLRTKMARFGIIRTLVTDNGTCFTSEKFREFTNANGMKHVTISPYHPQSNGQAERTVRTVKGSLKKISGGNNEAVNIINNGLKTFTKDSLEQRISRILMRHRRTPLACGQSPAELMLGRNIVTTMDLCHPRNQVEITEFYNKSTSNYQISDHIYVRNYARGPKWIPGFITKRIGKAMFGVQCGNQMLRKHQNQLKKRYTNKETLSEHKFEATTDGATSNENDWFPFNITPEIPVRLDQSEESISNDQRSDTVEAEQHPETDNITLPRRSQRQRLPVVKLGV